MIYCIFLFNKLEKAADIIIFIKMPIVFIILLYILVIIFNDLKVS